MDVGAGRLKRMERNAWILMDWRIGTAHDCSMVLERAALGPWPCTHDTEKVDVGLDCAAGTRMRYARPCAVSHAPATKYPAKHSKPNPFFPPVPQLFLLPGD